MGRAVWNTGTLQSRRLTVISKRHTVSALSRSRPTISAFSSTSGSRAFRYLLAVKRFPAFLPKLSFTQVFAAETSPTPPSLSHRRFLLSPRPALLQLYVYAQIRATSGRLGLTWRYEKTFPAPITFGPLLLWGTCRRVRLGREPCTSAATRVLQTPA